MLIAELAAGVLERDTLGMTLCRLLAVCDFTHERSLPWLYPGARRVPAMAELRLERSWCGHYARSRLDCSPVIGPWEGGLENLLLANGLLPGVVVVGTIKRATWANWGHLVVGGVLAAWIAIQLLLIGYGALIQPIFGVLGVTIAGLGFIALRRAKLEPRVSA